MSLKNLLQSVRDYLMMFEKEKYVHEERIHPKTRHRKIRGLDRRDDKIISAIKEIDRMYFVPERFKDVAYIDMALPIGENETISQPSTVARMLQLLDLKEGESVLEIGTGSGWNASLIGKLVGRGGVVSLEINPLLAERARKKLRGLGIVNVEIRGEDFRMINKKFDKIIFTAGISNYQEKIIEDFALKNLNKNGILICPFQSGPLIVIKKTRGIEKSYIGDTYGFVRLVV